jgi:hypothetical protein
MMVVMAMDLVNPKSKPSRSAARIAKTDAAAADDAAHRPYVGIVHADHDGWKSGRRR